MMTKNYKTKLWYHPYSWILFTSPYTNGKNMYNGDRNIP